MTCEFCICLKHQFILSETIAIRPRMRAMRRRFWWGASNRKKYHFYLSKSCDLLLRQKEWLFLHPLCNSAASLFSTVIWIIPLRYFSLGSPKRSLVVAFPSNSKGVQCVGEEWEVGLWMPLWWRLQFCGLEEFASSMPFLKLAWLDLKPIHLSQVPNQIN